MEVENVGIRGNVIVNNAVGGGASPYGIQLNALTAVSAATPSMTVYRMMRPRNVWVENNALYDIAGSGIVVSTGRNVEVANNTIALAGTFGIYVDPASDYTYDTHVHNNAIVKLDANNGVSVPASSTSSGNVVYSGVADANALSAGVVAGLTYLPRIEASSTIDNAYAGASVVKRYGFDETMWGQPGYLSVGNGGGASDDLWPFPNEAAIKTLLTAHGDAARDWTAGALTLTEYIWSCLGTSGPP
jgi:hypothetical protein